MSHPDATASAALDAQVIRPAFFCFLDLVGDPRRVTTAGYDWAFSGTGDADLDGFTYEGINADFVDISEITVAEGGTETVTASISGLPVIDAATYTIIGDRANWQGRVARLWRIIRNEANVQQGGVQHYYTGYMTNLAIRATANEGQTIEMTIEGYISAHSQPSNRTYLDQERYDSGDLSAKAAIAIANGMSNSPLGNVASAPSLYGGGRGGFNQNVHFQ